MRKSLKLRHKVSIRLLCALINIFIAALAINVILSTDVAAAPGSGQHVVDSAVLPAAPQTTITVTNNNDSGAGSLRQAVLDANPWDTIVFAPQVSGTIILSSGVMMITKSLSIQGPGSDLLAVSGGNATNIFYLDFASMIITGLTIRDGNSPGCGGAICVTAGAGLSLSATVVVSNAGGLGGGIGNYGGTTVMNSSILNNTSGGTGGGIDNEGDLFVVNSIISGNQTFTAGGGINGSCFTSKTAIQNSTIANNRSAQHAGGIGLCAGTTLMITNTTISGNVSESSGGGGLDIYGTAWLFNSTVVSNSAISGGGIRNLSGSVIIKNSIVANNVNGGNCVGTLQSYGHNLSSSAACNFTSTGDIQNVTPLLGPLADNGGPTPTHLLLPASPAINAGDNNGCSATDQRGVLRPQAGICDIGAVEIAFHKALYLPSILR